MSWYVLQCRAGREAEMVNSLNQHLSREALEEAFYFQSERLWRSEGSWKRQKKELFPGYVFLQSENPGLLSEALEEYRQIVRRHDPRGDDCIGMIERFDFYKAAEHAYAVVATGETALYGCIILQKGTL